MALSKRHHKKVERIDKFVKDILARGGGDEEVLAGMSSHLTKFKFIMNNASNDEMDALGKKYKGFLRFAKLLEKLAGGIQDGIIDVPE